MALSRRLYRAQSLPLPETATPDVTPINAAFEAAGLSKRRHGLLAFYGRSKLEFAAL